MSEKEFKERSWCSKDYVIPTAIVKTIPTFVNQRHIAKKVISASKKNGTITVLVNGNPQVIPYTKLTYIGRYE